MTEFRANPKHSVNHLMKCEKIEREEGEEIVAEKREGGAKKRNYLLGWKTTATRQREGVLRLKKTQVSLVLAVEEDEGYGDMRFGMKK